MISRSLWGAYSIYDRFIHGPLSSARVIHKLPRLGTNSRTRKSMQQTPRNYAFAFGAILGCVMAAEAANAADAYNGGQIARRWCEPCHVVATGQQGTTGEARPFASIARRPGFDTGQLAVFLLDPHPKIAHAHRGGRSCGLYC